MNKRHFLAIVIAAMMAMQVLSGCGAKGDTSNADTQSSGAGSSAAASSETSSSSFTEYPVQTDQTLTMWNPQIATLHSSYTSYTESPFHMGLEKATGIKVDWQFPAAGTDREQAFNLMLASDDLPDIIVKNMYGSARQLIEDGLIRDLTNVMPQYSPAYWKVLQNNERFNKSAKTDAGQYWAYESLRESEWGATFVGPVIRQDWLAEQKLEMPNTIEEWTTVLRAFKEAYGAQLGFVLGRFVPGFSAAFGAYTTFHPNCYVDNDGKVQYSMVQPEWRDCIAQMNAWYKEGLIDPDSLSLDDAGIRSKVLNGKVGASITAISQLSNWSFDAEKSGSSAKWSGAPYVAQKEGEPVCFIQAEDTVSTYATSVTTSCPDEKLELAMRWLDFGYTEEGYKYWNFGTEGETYTVVDGAPKYTELLTKDPEGISIALSKYIGTVGSSIAVQAESMVKQKNVPAAVAAVDLWVQDNEASEHLMPAATSFTPEENATISATLVSINTYASEMALKFMTGEEPIENFDKFVSEIDKMDLSRALEVYQAGYDRFVAR